MRGWWLVVAGCLGLAACAGQARMPISTRSAAAIRDAAGSSLDAQLRLAGQCVQAMRQHPLPGTERQLLGGTLEVGPERLERAVCLGAVRAFVNGDLEPGVLRRLEAGKTTTDDLEQLEQILTPDLLGADI
jgi:hypothetical protein